MNCDTIISEFLGTENEDCCNSLLIWQMQCEFSKCVLKYIQKLQYSSIIDCCDELNELNLEMKKLKLINGCKSCGCPPTPQPPLPPTPPCPPCPSVGCTYAFEYLTEIGLDGAGPIIPPAPACSLVPIDPPNNAIDITDALLVLNWAGVAGATGYDVYFGAVSPPPLVSANQPASFYTISPPIEPSTTYYWKIVPKNAGGSATGCPTWTFTTADTPA
jgi:hypothetical protein